jgi:hypothetical protein
VGDVGLNGFGDEGQDASGLLSAGLDDSQDGFHETLPPALWVPNDNFRQITA